MKKVLIFKPWMRKNEIYFRYKEFIRALEKMNISYKVLLIKDKTGKGKSSLFAFLKLFIQAHKMRSEYDVVITPTKERQYLYFFFFKKLLKKKFVIDHISSNFFQESNFLTKNIEKKVYKNSDFIISFTESYRQKLIEFYNLDSKKFLHFIML